MTDKKSTLQIKFPFGKTFLLAFAFLILLVGTAEAALRFLPSLRQSLPEPSVGIPIRTYDLKVSYLRDSVAAREGVDVIFLGNSMVSRGIDSALFEAEIAKLTGKTVRAFNLGIPDLNVNDARVVTQYLQRAYQPCMIVYGLTLRDFLPVIPHQFYDSNPWIQYMLGRGSADGWLRENLLAYQYSLVYGNWTVPDFKVWLEDRAGLEQELSALGHGQMLRPLQDVTLPPSSDNSLDRRIVKMFSNKTISPDSLNALRDLIDLQNEYLKFSLVEIPIHASYVSLFPNQWDDHAAFIHEISQIAEGAGLPFWPSTGVLDIPDQDWATRHYLLTPSGSGIYTRWLAAEVAGAALLEDWGQTGGCNRTTPLSPLPIWSSDITDDLSPSNPLNINQAALRFLGFVLLALAVYYLLPRRLQNVWLLLVSYLFYLTWSWQFALSLVLLTLLNYFLARGLQKSDLRRGILLWLGIALNLLFLAFFKYARFFIPQALDWLAQQGVQTAGGGLNILLPVGLTFWMVQAISYLVDVSRRRVEAATEAVDFALYFAYFPKLISGPIERAKSFLGQLAQERVVDNAVLARSFTLILVGAFRKFVIADSLTALIPDKGVAPLETPSLTLLLWLFSYGIYLYNDFAGYTSMMRGVSGLFGIELSPNFRWPFFARNFTEFWNRWHMSLSFWLRDYIFFPLSRALRRRIPKPEHALNLILPPLVTMFVSGLWHGATANMLLWGLIHGLYLVFERLPVLLGRGITPPQNQPLWRQVLSRIVVFVLVSLAWVPFRLNVESALEYWRGIFTGPVWEMPDLRLIFLIAGALLLDGYQSRHQNETIFLKWPRPARAALLALALLVIFFITRSDFGAPFVYQGF